MGAIRPAILFASCLVLFPRDGAAQPTFVRVIGTSTTSTSTLTIPITVAIPRASTILIAKANFPCASSTVADSRGNSYASDGNFCNNGQDTSITRGYVATPLEAGDQIVFTFQGPIGSIATALEFRGLRDQGADTGLSTGDGNGTFATGAKSTSEDNELLIGEVYRYRQDGGGVAVTPEASWTTLSDVGNLLTCFKVAASAGSYSFSGTVGANDGLFNANWLAFRSFRFGEVNGDGVVDVFDIVVMSSAIVGNLSPGTAPFTGPFASGDVNRDGTLDIFDLILTMGYIVGNVSTLPA